MSVCPVPASASHTDYTTAGSITNTPPDTKFEICEGGTTSTISGPGGSSSTTVCCPNPGPQGPQGCALKWESAWVNNKTYNYESGTPCVTSIVTHNNVTYICKKTHSSTDTTSEPGVGPNWTTDWDIFMADVGHLKWAGTWETGKAYKVNDVVLGPTSGNGWVCMVDHTSNNDEPSTLQTNANWDPITDLSKSTLPEEEQSFLSGLMDGVMDWWKDAPLWQKLLAIAAGVGLAYAGYKIIDSMMQDGETNPDGESVDTRYNGTAGYNGSFTQPTLPVVVASIMEFAGYTPDQYDVSLLDNKEVNFSVTGGMNTRALLNQLALTYQFDVVPSGGVVKFVPKYQTPVRELTADDLGHQVMDSSLAGPAPYTAKRHQGIDLPRSITFTYFSAALDHNTFTQQAELFTFEDGQDVQIQVPFTLSDSDAKRIAETTLVNAHIEQQEFTFTTDYHNIDLEPGDVITIPVGTQGDVAQVRIKEINETEDGVLEFRCARSDYNTQSYEYSGVTVTTPPAQTSNVPVSIGYSDTLFIEVPPLTSNDGNPRLYGIVTGFGKAGWPGANLYKSVDGGNTYNFVASTSTKCTWGMVTNPTPAPAKGYYVWDDTTTISVTLKEGTLSNSTDIAVLNGQNWCMIGEELIGFVNATLTGANTYTLSRLLRGRRGSEVKCGTHLANELFVVLDGNLTYIDLPSSELGRVVKFKTVTMGSSLDKSPAFDIQPFGLNLLPWAPGNVQITKNNNDYVFTWVERPRLNNGLQDDRELVHDADWAGYGITIFGEPAATSVKRSAIVVVNTYTYTEAMQIADFGSVQTTLKASVVQLSTKVGGGYPAVIEY